MPRKDISSRDSFVMAAAGVVTLCLSTVLMMYAIRIIRDVGMELHAGMMLVFSPVLGILGIATVWKAGRVPGCENEKEKDDMN